MKKLELFFLIVIISVAFALRLYKINRPIADWHSWRQADTAAVARNFIKEGFNPFIPKYDDMSAQANGLNNPNRYRFVEFPIYNSLIAAVWFFTGINETYARLVTVFISIGSILALYLLVKKFSDQKTAILAAFFFATLPYNVFYSSTILPAPLMIFALIVLYLSFSNFLDNEKNIFWFLLSIFIANVAILTWPIVLIFMFPLLYLSFQKYGLQFIKKPKLIAIAVFSLLPFIAWRLWMSKFPEGVPSIMFVLNDSGIRFKGAFFRWIFAERIGKLILTVAGVPLFILGVLRKPSEKEKWFYFSILFSTLMFFAVFASGNVRHDYYQIPFILVASIFLAKGTTFMFNPPPVFNKFIGLVIGLTLIIFMYAFGYYEIKGFYWVNNPQIVEAGKAADKLLPKGASVVAPYNGDTAFLYQTNRPGYPFIDRPFRQYVDTGTQYLVSVDPNNPAIKKLTLDCNLLAKAKTYVIIQLSYECLE